MWPWVYAKSEKEPNGNQATPTRQQKREEKNKWMVAMDGTKSEGTDGEAGYLRRALTPDISTQGSTFSGRHEVPHTKDEDGSLPRPAD